MGARQILAKVDGQRWAKAVDGLASGTYTVTLTRREAGYVAGYVKNGTEYAVTLAEGRATCSCRDAMYRHTTCKHQAILALWLAWHPQQEQAQAERTPDLRLAKVRQSDGRITG